MLAGLAGILAVKIQSVAALLCGQPIGVSEDDPRWEHHDEFCSDCELCRDQVPLILFRGEGKDMLQAQFCTQCSQRAFKAGA